MRPRTLTVPTLLLAFLLVLAGPPTAGAGPVAGSGLLTQVSGVSPFDPNCGLAGQSGTNYPNSEVEPWIVVNPTDGDGDSIVGDNIVGLWQQDRWSNGGARGLVAGVTMNGGGTWQSVTIPGISECSGGTFERATDPWLSFAPNGELYSFSLSLDNTTSANALLVNESDDGGLTWSAPTSIVDGSDGFGFNDKNSLTADPNDANYVYAVWQRVGQGWFARTTTAATTDGVWEPARAIHIPTGGERTIAHQIVVLPAADGGDLINAFTRFGKGNKKFVDFLRSTDHGATWTGPFTISTLQSIGITDPETGAGVRAGTNIPDVAVDPASGDLYAVWQDARFDPASGRGRGGKRRHDSIALSSSTDGGLTWSAPIKVNQTPTSEPSGDQQAFTASVDVAPDGSVAVTYYDFRNNDSDAATLLTDHWTVHCHPSLSPCATDPSSVSWSETRVTDAPFDLSEAPVAGGLFVGDYEGLASEGGSFLPFFSQTHPGDPASIFFRRVGP